MVAQAKVRPWGLGKATGHEMFWVKNPGEKEM